MTFQDQETPEQSTDQLTFTVGERTFDAGTAATKIEAADTHIKTIESENQQYKDQLAALQAQVAQSTKLDDALAQLQAGTQESQTTEVTPSVSAEQIGAIANKQIEDYLAAQKVQEAQSAAQSLAENTFKETGNKLAEIYGEKVDEAVKAKATSLGVSVESLYDMAKSPTSASLLLETMKVPESANQSAPSGSFNTHNLHQKAPEQLVDYSNGVTSSTVMDALAKAGATY